MFNPTEYLEQPFGQIADLINAHAVNQPDRIRLDDDVEKLTWAETAAHVNLIAAQLQADGLQKARRFRYSARRPFVTRSPILGAIVAGGCAAPLTTSATPKQLAAMMVDSGAAHLFIDTAKRVELAESGVELPPIKHIMMDAAGDDAPLMVDWMAEEGAVPSDPQTGPEDPSNIIYSSGTTGTPKGIVHSRQMRWYQMAGGERSGYGKPGQVSLFSTPL